MFIDLFPAHFWLYFSYIVTFLLPLVYGFTLLYVRIHRVNRDTGWHPGAVLGAIFMLTGLLLVETMMQDFYVFYIYQALNHVPFSMNFGLALPPLLYFYFRKLMIPEKLGRKRLTIHLSPVAVIVLFEIMAILLHCTDQLSPGIILAGKIYIRIYPVPLILSAIFYLFYMTGLRKFYLKNINENYSFVEGIDLRRVNRMIILYVLLVACMLPSFVIQTIWLKHISNMALIMFVSYLFIRSLKEPHIHYESSFRVRIPLRQSNIGRTTHGPAPQPVFTGEVIPVKQEISADTLSPPAAENTAIPQQAIRKAELKNQLVALFEIKKIHLKNTLTLNEVAGMLHTNRTYISNIVNSEFNLNFYQFVNKYRIDEAIRIFRENPTISNNEVAEIVGFNSISSFILAFKYHTRYTPKECRRHYSSQGR